MQVDKLQMEPEEAHKLHQLYQQHRAGMTPADQAIASLYKRIAQGKVIIRALASITAAGLQAETGLPALAIARADMQAVRCYNMSDEVRFLGLRRRFGQLQRSSSAADLCIKVSMPGMTWKVENRVADVPLIPVHLRPRKAIDKYFVLWEADWYAYPVDPYLLRRCGADAWVVCAQWDLTPIERAVMSQRLNA